MFKALSRRDLWAALILLIPPLLLFWSVTLGPQTLLPVDNLFAFEPWLSYRQELGVGPPHNQLLSDLILENYVWKKFIRESLAARRLPLWNPYILTGQPFLANGQHSALYPFSLIFYLTPLSKAYGWFAVSQLWLAGLFMYIFMRTLRAGRLGALLAGLTYSVSAFFVFSVTFMMIIAGAVWLPLILALIEIIIRKQEAKGPTGYSPIPYVAAGAVGLGWQTLAGHVEITYYTLLVSGFYAACRLLVLWRRQQTPRFALRLGLWLAAMVLLGVGLGAVQLVPMYEIVSQNFRDDAVTLAQVREWALPLRRSLTFFIPDFLGNPAHHGYFDVVTRQWRPLGLNAHGQINPLCPGCTRWDTKNAIEGAAYVGILPLVLALVAILQAIWEKWPGSRRAGAQSRSGAAALESSGPEAQESGSAAAPESSGTGASERKAAAPDAQAAADRATAASTSSGATGTGGPVRPTFQTPVFIFTLLAGLSLLFAFGTPLYALLFYGLPGWNQLHSPFRWIFPYTLSIAVLAGLGAAYLDRRVSARLLKAGAQGSREAGAPGPGDAEKQGRGRSEALRPREVTEPESERDDEPGRSAATEQPGQQILPASSPERRTGASAGERLPERGPVYRLAPPSFLRSLAYYGGWLLFWGGLAGLVVLLVALVTPAPFIRGASVVFERSGLAQNAFATSRQFFGYQWPNFFKFFLMITAAGAVLRLVRCPIFTSSLRQRRRGAALTAGFAQEPESNPADSPLRPRSPAPLLRHPLVSLFRRPLVPQPVWKPLAVVVIAVDLLLASWGFNPAVDPALLDFKPEVVEWLEARQAEEPFFRINSFETPEGRGNKIYQANAGMAANLFDVRGYDSIIPAQYARFMHLIQENGDLLFNRIGPLYHNGYNALDSALLDLLGVRYILTTVEDIDNPNYDLVYEDEIRVYENTDALPRAFLVYQEMVYQEMEEAGRAGDLDFALRSLDPRREIILDGQTNALGRDLTPADAADLSRSLEPQVEIVAYTPNEVKILAHLNQPGWLVLADAYFPGWRAYAAPVPVAGDRAAISSSQVPVPAPKTEIEVTIHRANGNFRAVYLQPGAWQIRFRYSPRSFQLGLYSSFLAFVTLLFLLGYWSWGKLYRESAGDSPIKRIAKNSLVPMSMALSNRLIDLAFALLMLRILQPEGAGKYAFAVAFIGLTEILTRFGLGTLVTREVAADQTGANRYLANVTILRLYLWLAALPVMAAILGMYIIFGEVTPDLIITIVLLALGTLLSNFSDGLTAIFYAHEKAEYPAAIASVTTLSRVSVGALVLILGWGIVGLAAASLIANLVAFVTLGYILVVKIYRPWPESDRPLQREMMAESFPLMINHLLSTIFFRIDVFILKPTWGNEAVGYYNAAYKYIDGINIIPQYFTLAIFPLMSRFAAGSRDSLIRAYLLSLRLLLILALPLAAGTPFIAHELILFLAGDGFLPDSMIVLQLLIWFLPFSFVNQVTQYVLIAINQQRHLTRAFIIGVLFNLITNLIFIPMYGYRAAAVTTIFSEWALLIPFYLLVRRHLCPVPWVDVAWRPTAAAAIMAGVLGVIGDINFFLTVAVAAVVYVSALALAGGFNQTDMNVIWRAIPWQRLLRRGELQRL